MFDNSYLEVYWFVDYDNLLDLKIRIKTICLFTTASQLRKIFQYQLSINTTSLSNSICLDPVTASDYDSILASINT